MQRLIDCTFIKREDVLLLVVERVGVECSVDTFGDNLLRHFNEIIAIIGVQFDCI